MRFTIAARICDRLEAMLAPAGITARRPNMVGASSYVSTFLGRHGREGAIRISALPFDALRFELHEDYAWHGWTGERRIADIAGPPDDAPFVASPNLIAQILAYFGSDPDQRDVMIATAGRAERHARAGATRRGRRVAAERALAETHTRPRRTRPAPRISDPGAGPRFRSEQRRTRAYARAHRPSRRRARHVGGHRAAATMRLVGQGNCIWSADGRQHEPPTRS